MHTDSSDGIFDYKKVILNSINLGLEVISITDHDNVDKVKEAIEFSKMKNIFVIPGVELTADYSTGTCHILGYNIDINVIDKFTEYIKKSRVEKAIKMISMLNKLGYDVTYDEVLNACPNKIIGRREIAKVLVRKKYFQTEDLAINDLFCEGKPCYFKTKTKSIEECINAIKVSGGIAVLAHPWTLNLSLEELKNFVLKYEFNGIEVYNHNISYNEFVLLDDLANSLNLYKTCGTDFHGQKGLYDMVVKQNVDCGKILNKLIRR